MPFIFAPVSDAIRQGRAGQRATAFCVARNGAESGRLQKNQGKKNGAMKRRFHELAAKRHQR